jgi:hypothetical protein
MQEKFSWNAVASAGLTAGLTGGIDTTKPWYEIAQKAALNNAISQGVSIAAGQQEKFDWKAVAVAAIAAPISASAGRTIGGTSNSSQYNNQGFTANGFGPDLANGVARGAVTQGVRMLVDGRGKMDWTKIAADAFGNALGNGIAAELSRDPRAANLAAHALGGSLGAQDEFERAMPIFAESTQQDGELGARAIRDGEARFAIPMESAHEAALGTGLLPGSETGLRLDSRDIDAFTGRIRFDRPPQLGEAVIDDVFPSIDKVLGTGQHSTATSDGNRVYVADAGGFVEKIFSDARNTVEYGLGNFVKGYKGEHSVVDGPPTPLEYVGGIARGLRDFIPGYSFMADAQNNFRLGNYGMAALLGGSALADVLLTLPTGGENLLLRQFGRRGVSEAVQLRSELRLLDVSEWTANQTGALAEARASLVFQRAGYQELPAKLASNNGFDGVFVKHDVWGRPSDIIVNESKFTSTWNVSLSNTGMGLQTSPSWINANIQKMLLSDDLAVRNTGKLLQENREMVRVKINVLDGQGVNRWHVLKPAE